MRSTEPRGILNHIDSVQHFSKSFKVLYYCLLDSSNIDSGPYVQTPA